MFDNRMPADPPDNIVTADCSEWDHDERSSPYSGRMRTCRSASGCSSLADESIDLVLIEGTGAEMMMTRHRFSSKRH